MNDSNTKIGDVFRVGEAVIQVGSPRVPCNKISQRFELQMLDAFVNKHLITGWYYRVLEPGEICVGDKVELEVTDSGSLSVRQFMSLVNDKDADLASLEIAAGLSELDPEWQKRMAQRVKRASK